jgi:hypothetical protein
VSKNRYDLNRRSLNLTHTKHAISSLFFFSQLKESEKCRKCKAKAFQEAATTCGTETARGKETGQENKKEKDR